MGDSIDDIHDTLNTFQNTIHKGSEEDAGVDINIIILDHEEGDKRIHRTIEEQK